MRTNVCLWTAGRRVRTDARTGVYSAGFAPTRRRSLGPRIGAAVRRTRFGLDLPIRQKTGRPQVLVMPPPWLHANPQLCAILACCSDWEFTE